MRRCSLVGFFLFSSIAFIQTTEARPQAAVRHAFPIDKSEIAVHASVYEVFLSNAMAWETGDILVRVTELEDSTERSGKVGDLVVESTVTYRIRFDHASRQYLCLRQFEFELLLLAHPELDADSIEKNRIEQIGFSLQNEVATMRKVPQKLRKLKANLTPSDLFEKFSIPEFRSTGLVTEAMGGSMAHLNTLVTRLSGGNDIASASHTLAGNLKFTRRTPVPGSGGEQFFVTDIEFDDESCLPILKDSKVDVVSSEGTRKVVPNFIERIKWKELSGVYVPESLSKESKGHTRIGGKKFGVDRTVNMEFKWISLNKEMNVEDFDAKLLEDFDSLLKFDEVKNKPND